MNMTAPLISSDGCVTSSVVSLCSLELASDGWLGSGRGGEGLRAV